MMLQWTRDKNSQFGGHEFAIGRDFNYYIFRDSSSHKRIFIKDKINPDIQGHLIKRLKVKEAKWFCEEFEKLVNDKRELRLVIEKHLLSRLREKRGD